MMTTTKARPCTKLDGESITAEGGKDGFPTKQHPSSSKEECPAPNGGEHAHGGTDTISQVAHQSDDGTGHLHAPVAAVRAAVASG